MNLEKYAVGSELAQKGDFHIANISMLIKEENMIEGEDFLKFGTITLINKESPFLPAYIKKVIDEHELTDLTGLFPIGFIEDELSEEQEFNEEDIVLNSDGIEDVQKISVKNYLPKIAGKYTDVTVGKKKFIRLTDEKLIEAFNDKKIRSILNTTDFPAANDYVDDYLELTKQKVLAWY